MVGHAAAAPLKLQLSPAMLGELRRLDAREVWKHEAGDFTPWLLQHAKLLGDALGIDIELTEREVGVGDFSVDLVGRVAGSDRTLIVENQIAPTDHSHLGQLLTYAAGLEAVHIIWITPQFRDEHRRALDWLNEVTREGISFFGIELELLQIVDSTGNASSPAPHFKLVAQPNDWQKQAQSTGPAASKAPSERERAYQKFFSAFLQRVKQEIPGMTSAQRVGGESWFNLPSGYSGIVYSANFTGSGQFRVELYLGKPDRDANKKLFDALHAHRDSVQAAVPEQLQWERLDNRNACRIAVYRPGTIIDPSAQLEELQEFGVRMVRTLRTVFSPHLQRLTSTPPSVGSAAADSASAMDIERPTEDEESPP